MKAWWPFEDIDRLNHSKCIVVIQTLLNYYLRIKLHTKCDLKWFYLVHMYIDMTMFSLYVLVLITIICKYVKKTGLSEMCPFGTFSGVKTNEPNSM